MARTLCNNCNFSLSTCICSAVKDVNNHVNVIILQHPSEEKIAKNTAKLLNLSLSGCQIIKGENNNDFDILKSLPLETTVLLYPNEQAINLDDKAQSDELKKNHSFNRDRWHMEKSLQNITTHYVIKSV